MATMIETDLKEVLDRIDRRLGAIESDMTTLKVSHARIEGELSTVKNELAFVREDVKDLKSSQRSQIWALIITVIGATIAAVVKFGFFPNP
jgi:chromosome segregation ATPase